LIASDLIAAEIGEAHDLLTRYLVVSRLVSPASTEPHEATRALVAERCGAKDWPQLLAMLDAARQSVARSWGAIVASVA
jgi:glutamate-ammonia-ligase adenylyltransferase